MVHNPVDDRRGHVVVAEHGSPPGELNIRRDDQTAVLVTVRYHLEQQSCPLGIDREVAQLVDLCRCRHRLTYAESATMPRVLPGCAVGQRFEWL